MLSMGAGTSRLRLWAGTVDSLLCIPPSAVDRNAGMQF